MPLIQTIQSGKTDKPPRLMIYGPEGIGKTKFATKTHKPVFIDIEDGVGAFDAPRFPLAKSWDDVAAQLAAVRDEPHEFGTLVVDSLDFLERLIHDRVCADFGAKNLEKVDGGYGRGYSYALSYWRKFVTALEEIRDRRAMCIVLLAHSKVEKFQDPDAAADYDRYSPRLHKLANALISDWVDAILFATRRIRVSKEDGKATAIGAGGGQRVLRTVGGPSCVAKNRFDLPDEIDLSWTSFVENIGKGAVRG